MLESAAPQHTPTVSLITLMKIVAFGLALGFLYVIRDVVGLLFLTLVFASVINPLATWFQRHGMNRTFGIALLYLVILGVVAAITALLVPALLHEALDLAANADAIWDRASEWLGPLRSYVDSHGLSAMLREFISGAFQDGGTAAGGIVTTARHLFTATFSVIVVFVMTFYLVISEDGVGRLFRAVAPEATHAYLVDLFSRIQLALGSWARAQVILSAVVGSAVFIMLKLLGVKYALVLASLAAVAEFAPYLGPIAAAVPGVLIALTQSPLEGGLAAIGYYLIHLLESHVIVPNVMRRATGLHPVVCILSLLIGLKVAGPAGALFAMPVATMLSVVLGDGFRRMKNTTSSP